MLRISSTFFARIKINIATLLPVSATELSEERVNKKKNFDRSKIVSQADKYRR